MKHAEKELQKAEKRKTELDNLFAKMYEDRAAGRLDDENYTMLSGRYRGEQRQINERVETLKTKIEQSEQNKCGAEQWLALIKKYESIYELTAPLLNELIEKIEVHQAYKDENGNKIRDIDICYRFVGKID
ncbi:MAG: DUF4368 domain-containing protein [Oscillospiraceae bacterium]|nr:DUF4368 domain-containing protein [Oscillospiraceae bacterium]